MTESPNDDGREDDGEMHEDPLRSERDIQAQELLDNAAKVKGDDFANYASSLIELSQLNMIILKLGTGKIEETERVMLVAIARQLTASVDTKIFTQLSMQDRAEAGKLAEQIVVMTKKAGG